MREQAEIQIDTEVIKNILSRGNTAEVKMTRDGVIILEVNRKKRFEEK